MNNFYLLKLLPLSLTSDWNIKQTFNRQNIFSKYSKQRIGYAINRIKDDMIVKDDVIYKRLTIKINNGGVSVRDKIIGAQIKTKNQYLIKTGQLAVSKIDARNGAFGIVPEEADQAIITGNFWVYDIDITKANIEFLTLMFSASKFVKVWEDCSNGSGNRLYLQESAFLDYSIPLPDITIQNELISKYNELIRQADEADKEAVELENEIERYLFEVLGICLDVSTKKDTTLLTTVRYKELPIRWDIWSLNNLPKSNKYKYKPLGTVLSDKPMYGANEKSIKVKTSIRYIRITDINEDGSLNDDFVSAQNVENKYLLANNNFLIARSGNTVGKTFLFKSEMGQALFAGYLIKFKLNENKIIPEYLLYYTKSKLFKLWIEGNQRIFGQPNINGQEYLNAEIIVPDMLTQQNIVNHISNINAKIKKLKQQAINLRDKAKKKFEEDIFDE